MLHEFCDWTFGSALETWADLGFDKARGRFRERLDTAGRPIDVPHRAMVQARQIYVFAHAALLGRGPTEAGRLAETAMASLLRDYLTSSGPAAGFRFSVAADGSAGSDVRDSYTHAFVLFALGWLYRLNGDRELLQVAESTTEFIEQCLIDPVHGGLFEASPVTDQSKRQNPLMHLLEAYICLEDAAPGRGYVERCRRLVELMRERIFRPNPGLLLEHFSTDWRVHPDPEKAGAWEPGHHLEWVWLPGEYARVSGDRTLDVANLLWSSALRHGVSVDGLLVDEAGLDLAVTKGSHRVWPHTEGVKAAAARQVQGDKGARSFADNMSSGLMTKFLDRPFPGGWIDHVGANGHPLVEYVPASSLYHIFLAAAVARETWPELTQDGGRHATR